MNPAYFFDMDGVISDTQKIHAAREYAHLTQIIGGIPQYQWADLTPDLITAHFAGVKASYWMTQILQGHGIAHTPEQVEDDLCRLHDTLASDIESGRVNVDPIPGSFEFMIRLIQRNRYITVITASKAKLAEKVLEKMNVRDGIKHIFSAEDLAKYEWGKANPQVFTDMLQELWLPPNYPFIMFEDGKSGIAGANAAGGKTVGILGDRHESSLPWAHQYLRDFRWLTPEKLDTILNSSYVRH